MLFDLSLFPQQADFYSYTELYLPLGGACVSLSQFSNCQSLPLVPSFPRLRVLSTGLTPGTASQPPRVLGLLVGTTLHVDRAGALVFIQRHLSTCRE